MKEEWKDVIGYEGVYQISNLGRCKRLYKHRKEKILKPIKTHHGYFNYSFCVNSKFKAMSIHRLVAIHFIPNPNNYPEVNHKDANKENYSVDNLEWCTRSYNMKHAHGLGLVFPNKATDAIRKINKINTPIILKMKEKNFTLEEISIISNISISAISKLVISNSLDNIK